jgi:Yip1 domain
MAQTHLPHMPHYERMDTLSKKHTSVMKLFFLYALPLSLVPPVMIHYSGDKFAGNLLPMLSNMQLLATCVIFFVAELAMTFLAAYVIQRMGQAIKRRPVFEDAYKVAVIAPTPLWLAPLFLFIPSVIVNATILAVALIISGILVFYNAATILKVEDEGQAILMSGTIVAIGMAAWAVMMYLTLVTWNWIIFAKPLLH